MAHTIPSFPGFRKYIIPIYSFNTRRDVYIKTKGHTCICSNVSKTINKSILGTDKSKVVNEPYIYSLWVDCRDITKKEADVRQNAVRRIIKRILQNKRVVNGTRGNTSVNIRSPYIYVVVEKSPELLEVEKEVEEHFNSEKKRLLNDDYFNEKYNTIAENTRKAGGDINDDMLKQSVKNLIQEEIDEKYFIYRECVSNKYNNFTAPTSEDAVKPVKTVKPTKYKKEEPKTEESVKESNVREVMPKWATELSSIFGDNENTLNKFTDEIYNLMDTIRANAEDIEPFPMDETVPLDAIKTIMNLITSNKSNEWKQEVHRVNGIIDDLEVPQ